MDLPKNLDEAIEFLINDCPSEEAEHLKKWASLSELVAVTDIHLGAGMRLRNNLNLWHGNDLTKWFNSIGISHADDMSAIIHTSIHRKLNNKKINLEEQVKRYQNYWKKNGFPDGIPHG